MVLVKTKKKYSAAIIRHPAVGIEDPTGHDGQSDAADVTVTFSNKILTATNVNTIFKFNTGTVNGSNAVKNLPNVLSRISNVTIGGPVIGSDGTADHFGIVAENIGNLTINGAVVPLFPGAHNDNRLLSADIDGFFGNLRLREI